MNGHTDMTVKWELMMNLFDGTFANIVRTRRGWQIDILGETTDHTKSVWDEVYDDPFKAFNRMKELNLGLGALVE